MSSYLGADTRDDERPLISVIIPTHNRATLVGRAVTSVLDQSYSHLEVIVVNDGSTDETPATLELLAASDGLRVVTNEAPLSGGAARNRGLAVAKGELAYLDDDDVWLQLEHQHRLAPYYSVVGASPPRQTGGVSALRQQYLSPTARRRFNHQWASRRLLQQCRFVSSVA